MHQMDLEYEHGCTNNTAIWKRGVKSVQSACMCVWCLLSRVTASRSSVLEKGHRAGVEHTNNRRSVERWGWELRDHLPTRPSQRHMAPAIDAGTNSAHYRRRKCWNSAMWKQSECVRALPRTCTPLCTVIVMVDVGVASLCGTRSREQVGSGWSRESVLIVFVPQSCLAVVKAASTSWEANCSIYTGRRFPFFLSIFFFQMYLFNSFYFTKGNVSTSSCVREWSCCVQPAFCQIYRQNLKSELSRLSHL